MVNVKSEEIKKSMNILEAMAIFPKVNTILSKNQIKSLKVFESLEKNILAAGKDPDKILEEINTEFEESKKPVEVDLDKILEVTEEAAKELRGLMDKGGKKGWALRVLVHSPSPNKYSYAMDFEKRPAKDDIVMKKHDLKIFISKNHLDTIKNIVLEFDRKDGGFRFEKRSDTYEKGRFGKEDRSELGS